MFIIFWSASLLYSGLRTARNYLRCAACACVGQFVEFSGLSRFICLPLTLHKLSLSTWNGVTFFATINLWFSYNLPVVIKRFCSRGTNKPAGAGGGMAQVVHSHEPVCPLLAHRLQQECMWKWISLQMLWFCPLFMRARFYSVQCDPPERSVSTETVPDIFMQREHNRAEWISADVSGVWPTTWVCANRLHSVLRSITERVWDHFYRQSWKDE